MENETEREDMTNEEIYEWIKDELSIFEMSDMIDKVIIIGKHGKLRMVEIVTDNEKGMRYIG